MNRETIKERFDNIKHDRFYWPRPKKDRMKEKPFVWVFFLLWRRYQELLAYRLRLKKPFANAKTFWGDTIKMILPYHPYLYFLGFYGLNDIFLTDFIINHLKEGDTFIDAGANIGYYTLLASAIVGEQGRVYGFEPTPNVFETLHENTEDKKNVSITGKALWEKTGMVPFTDFGIELSLYNSCLTPDKLPIGHLSKEQMDTIETISVEKTTLDEHCKIYNLRPDFIKLDTEGSEHQILLGAENVIATCEPIIATEVWKLTVENGVFEETLSLLSSYQYTCYQLLDGFRLVPIEKPEYINPQFNNIVFLYNEN